MLRSNLFHAAIAISALALSTPAARSQSGFAPVAKLTASDGIRYSGFGQTLAAHEGDTVAIGESCIQLSVPSCSSLENAVYIYKMKSTGWKSMTQLAKLTPSDGYPGDHFGYASVAISGNTIIVSGDQGKTYVYVEPPTGWTDMTETAQLLVGASTVGLGFVSASIDRGTIVVGAPYATVDGVPGEGAAFVFEEPSTGWATTSQYTAELTPSDGAVPYYLFGILTAVNGGTIVVSAPNQPNKVYVFSQPAAGWQNATQTAILSRSVPGIPGYFGDALAIYSNTIVIGDPVGDAGKNPPQDRGVVDIYVRPSSGWVDSTESAELSPPDETVANFGNAIAYDENLIAVGTFGGNKAYVYYAPPSGVWHSTSQPYATLSEGNGSNAIFGIPIAIGDNTMGQSVIVGNSNDTVNGRQDEGAVYVFAPAPGIDYSSGFSSATGLSLNGSATLSGTSLELTDGGINEAGSAFYSEPLNIQLFAAQFDFQLKNPHADGFTFALQNTGPDALGSPGGSLGYRHIHQSVAVKFDLYSNAGEGSNSTGIYLDGVSPTVPSTNLTGINLHSGDPMRAIFTYDGKTLDMTLYDLGTPGGYWFQQFPIDIPAAVDGDTAYVGFTAGTGGLTATQEILNWTFE
jgi:hypothetical protein